jgi:hypothetical protein
MKAGALILSCLICLALQANVTNAQEQTASVFADSLKIIAGELKIVALDQSCKFNVTLNGKVVLRTDCDDEKGASIGEGSWWWWPLL